MTMKEYCKAYKVKVSPEVKRADAFLTRKGYRFLIEYGTENAVQVARDGFGFRAADPSIKSLNGMVLRLLRDHQWWTPYDLCDQILAKYAILVSDSSITARLRDLRHPEYGFHLIEKRRIVNSNAYEYRLGK